MKKQAYWIAIVTFRDGTKLYSDKFYEYDEGIKEWSSKFSYFIGAGLLDSIRYEGSEV